MNFKFLLAGNKNDEDEIPNVIPPTAQTNDVRFPSKTTLYMSRLDGISSSF